MSNRQNLSVLSWNIQDSVGDKANKFEVSDFLSIISDKSIVCLQETKALVKIEGFVSFNSNRKGLRSGGVCILAQNCIRKGITNVKCTESDDIVAVKLDRHYFRLDFDLFLICFYISPSTSSLVKRNPDYTNQTFNSLNAIAHKLKQKGEVILCGDANSRTASLPDFITSYNSSSTFDVYDDIGFEVDISEHRNNCDKIVVAPHSQLFLDFVINNQLKILNGRTLGDSMGKTTCHKWNGSSSVDYFVASSWVRDLVSTLQVKPLNSYSDHCPLLLNVTTSKPFHTSLELPQFSTMPTRFKWDSNVSPKQFSDALDSPEVLPKLKHILETPYDHDLNSNNEIADDLMSCFQAAAKISLKSSKKPAKLPHKKWFDRDCLRSKRNLNRLANRLSRNVKNNLCRAAYYTERNKHSHLIKKKRLNFLDNLNRAIEDGHILDWKRFKQLKQNNTSSPLLDKFDLLSFYDFFTQLYKKPENGPELPSSNSNIPASISQKTDILNRAITMSEAQKAIKNLKKGKSCSTDQISNEMLQSLNLTGLLALLKTFNHCLKSGRYPWHTSVITPIFKSGNPFSPDNYRAIAVGSCMGKLFSGILLDRLLLFKELYCSDPKEQLGFQKGAQTNDHVLTLKTVIDKYTKKHRVRLYTCFVDLRKAFDTVARDLLLHKIASLDIKGEFFDVISDMYSNSLAKIKISNLLSPDIKMLRGTEQGHPLSPDLFKIFIHELSSLLKSTGNYPHLNFTFVSHLLWADDLVLMALDPKSLQTNIDILNNFCVKMGLEINLKKTKVVTFCPSRLKPLLETFRLGDNIIEHTDKYCYLGIIFDQNGSFSSANSELRAKALRAYYSLKNNIIKSSLSFKSTTTLFDTLVKPVLLYGCQIIAPHFKTMKYLYNLKTETPSDNFLKYLAQDHYERFHLKFLKWNLSVHQKASNVGCWGDSGRYPLFVEAIKLSIDYFERAQDSFNKSDGTLLAAAFSVQKDLGLDWYTNLTKVCSRYQDSSISTKRQSTSVAECVRKEFTKHWSICKSTSPKLEFYNQIKSDFRTEDYLSLVEDPNHRASLTRLRISSHNLYIERGRYETPLVPREDRWCTYCYQNSGYKPVESESHVLLFCPLYKSLKKRIFCADVPSPQDTLNLLATKHRKCAVLIGKMVHGILELNQHYTSYYNTQDFHLAPGGCIVV